MVVCDLYAGHVIWRTWPRWDSERKCGIRRNIGNSEQYI